MNFHVCAEIPIYIKTLNCVICARVLAADRHTFMYKYSDASITMSSWKRCYSKTKVGLTTTPSPKKTEEKTCGRCVVCTVNEIWYLDFNCKASKRKKIQIYWKPNKLKKVERIQWKEYSVLNRSISTHV